MYSAYDLKSFYISRQGRVIRRILQRHICEFWSDTHGLRIMGYGYAVPYLRMFKEDAERVFAMMPVGQGVHHWPQDEKNLVALCEETELPVENSSIDRILLIHSMEYAEMLRPLLGEVYRVLKANGRLLVVVPNRTGLWARADWAPFGHGTPYTASQICHYLGDNMFSHERTKEALFMPPVRHSLVYQSAKFFEAIGQACLPFVAGVHMVEASKQVFASRPRDSGSRVTVRGRSFIPQPVSSIGNSMKQEK